jgi:predicted RNA-binding Zn-ribbon protein involved in translation (DUF1610 family)
MVWFTMSNYVDLKFIHTLSTRLLKFKEVGHNAWAFRCPICGDSKKSQNKTRGYIYEKDGYFKFKCHNCGEVKSLAQFIEFVDSSLYADYQMERFFSQPRKARTDVLPDAPMKKFNVYDVGELGELVSMDELDDISSVKQYVIQRMIPPEHFRHLFYCDKFKSFVNKLLPNKLKEAVIEEPRLVIPFFDENKKMFAFAGRSFKKFTSLRYINIVLDETKPKLFGIERWNKDEETIVVEGPLDALFLPNCIATAGGDLISAIRGNDKTKFIIVYDNEPRSVTTRKKIAKAIDCGYRVCIWPKNNPHKDVNKMVQEGMTPLDIHRQICQNAFYGFKAKLRMSQ